MAIALESILFLLGGIVLTVILISLFGRQSQLPTPVVKLIRVVEFTDSHEETRLLINDELIMSVSDEGLRQAGYSAETEHLEAVATRIAAALNTNVAFSRVSAHADRGKSSRASDQTTYEEPAPPKGQASMRDRSSRS